MLYVSKRSTGEQQSSGVETIVSISGLIIAIGFLGGLSSLIYGLVRGSSQGTIGGGIVLGVSIICGVLLALVFIFCLKNNNNINSNTQTNQSVGAAGTNKRNRNGNHQQKHRAQQRQFKPEHSSSHEITVISGVHTFEKSSQQRQSNDYDMKRIPPSRQSSILTESTHSYSGKQGPQSPLKGSSFAYLNQSNGSMTHPNYSSSPTTYNPKVHNMQQY